VIQTKLAINQPGDEYEQEADRVSEQVMCMPEPQAREQVRLHPEGIQSSKGYFAPTPSASRRLLAREIVHVLQSPSDAHVARETDAEKEKEAKKAVQDAAPGQDATASDAGVPQVDAASETHSTSSPPAATTASPSTEEKPSASTTSSSEAKPAASPPSAAPDSSSEEKPTFTPGGHTPAPPGMAACPDAPPRALLVVGCVTTPAASPPSKETAVLPAPPVGPFRGDTDLAQFARELALCRASREVKGVIEKRFQTDISAAGKSAAEEAKIEAEAAVKAAAEGLDPKDKKAISKARAQATAEAKKATAKKIAAAKAAVKRQDVAAVTTELASGFEKDLATDFDATIAGAIHRYNPAAGMQKKLDSERKRITKEKSKKPKVKKGETPPPAKTADQIAAEVEAEMVQVRCDQDEWVRNEFERYKHAWAVAQREKVDYLTIENAPYLKDFKPTYEVATADLVQIPANLQGDKNMPGVAPEMADFLTQLATDPNTPTFTAENYGRHGFGVWEGKGFSVDLRLNEKKLDATGSPKYSDVRLDQRGFYKHADAVRFLLALDATAKKLGARWRVLYNDFGVIHEVNQATGVRNVGFVGEPHKGDLNYHGPDPLILHFHLDLEIPQKKPTAGSQP
jgi:hypothetical protein